MNKSILEFIGNTPMMKLKSGLYAKLEFFNPFGSIKDRTALQILNDAKNKGLLPFGTTIIEASSGNMGISLAAIGSILGYKTIITMPENMSERRRTMIRAYGGEVVLTEAQNGMRGAISKAEYLSNKTEYSYMPHQFDNYSGVFAHYFTTAPEIARQSNGRVDVIVCGIGTGGTITGIANYFYGRNVKIIGVEPEKSPFFSRGYSGMHRIEGIGAGFCPQIMNINLINEIISVSDEDAFSCKRELFENEGLFVGISSGAVYAAAKQLTSRKEFQGKMIVMIFADGGDRYL